MKIIIGKFSGFCIGVKKAVYRISDELNKNEDLYIYGEIIHNPQTVSVLKYRGLEKITNLESIDGCRVAVRTHGIPFDELKDINKRAVQTINLTCSKVARVQGIIKKYATDGYFTVILGDKNHAEVESLKSYASSGYVIISSLEELQTLKKHERMILVSQTTLNTDFFRECESFLLSNGFSIKIFNTICDSTQNRQDELINVINDRINKVVVIGGKNSGNTKRLAEISRNRNVKTFLVEDADELKSNDFSRSDRIFVTAGASTPSWIINNVISRLHDIKNRNSWLPRKIFFLTNLLADKYRMFEFAAGLILTGSASFISGQPLPAEGYVITSLLFFCGGLIFPLSDSVINYSDHEKKHVHKYFGIGILTLVMLSLTGAYILNKYSGNSLYLMPLPLLFLTAVPVIRKSLAGISCKAVKIFFSANFIQSLYYSLIIFILTGLIEFTLESLILSVNVFILFFLRNAVSELINFEGDVIFGNQTLFSLFGKKPSMFFIVLAVSAAAVLNSVSLVAGNPLFVIFTFTGIVYLLMMKHLRGIIYLYEFRFRMFSDYILLSGTVFFLGLLLIKAF